MAKTTNSPRVIISSTASGLRVPRKKLAALAAFVAQREGVRLGLLDLAIVGRREIAGVNRRWLGHAGETDVISFDLTEEAGAGISAQLVVCGPVAVAQGPLHGNTPQRELMLYVVHGLLHVIGYDDLSVRAAAKMHARQDELLREFDK